MSTCKGITSTGEKCKRNVSNGYCHQHSNQKTQDSKTKMENKNEKPQSNQNEKPQQIYRLSESFVSYRNGGVDIHMSLFLNFEDAEKKIEENHKLMCEDAPVIVSIEELSPSLCDDCKVKLCDDDCVGEHEGYEEYYYCERFKESLCSNCRNVYDSLAHVIDLDDCPLADEHDYGAYISLERYEGLQLTSPYVDLGSVNM